MKNVFMCFLMLASMLTFGQNQSLGLIPTNLTPVAPNEIFRFRPGNVTQLDAGTGFGFGASNRWFSLGKVVTGTNTAFGLRFQAGEKAVTFGYQDVSQINPRIEWIGTGSNLGNLEFRSATSFSSTTSNLLATFTGDGRSVFGSTIPITPSPVASAKVSIVSDKITGLVVENALSANVRAGILVNVSNTSNSATGLTAEATCGNCTEIGVRGNTTGLGNFEAGIYGETASNIGGNVWAGFFDGDIFVSGTITNPSDAKFKENVKQETNILSKIESLNPVSYNYIESKDINLANGLQHGFIAQELEKVFPELTTNVSKPIFDKEGNVTSNINFKSVNYNGMISVLTQAVKELNNELKVLKSEINTLKENKTINGDNNVSIQNKETFIAQNIPNPFADQTNIKYQLPIGTTNAQLMILNLNGNLVKSYKLNPNEKELTIQSADIGKGLFIYSLVVNGEEIMTKKMIVQ